MKTFIFALAFCLFAGFEALAQGQAHPPPGYHPPPPYSGISLRYLGFWFTGPGCFIEGQPPSVPSHVLIPIRKGGVMVETTAGYRIMMPFDPLVLTGRDRRVRIDDMIASGPNGIGLYPRYQPLPYGFVELFQIPPEGTLCTPWPSF